MHGRSTAIALYEDFALHRRDHENIMKQCIEESTQGSQSPLESEKELADIFHTIEMIKEKASINEEKKNEQMFRVRTKLLCLYFTSLDPTPKTETSKQAKFKKDRANETNIFPSKLKKKQKNSQKKKQSVVRMSINLAKPQQNKLKAKLKKSRSENALEKFRSIRIN
jgi:hypothetical protein